MKWKAPIVSVIGAPKLIQVQLLPMALHAVLENTQLSV